MTAFAMVAGRLFRAPESKTSKAGKAFTLAKLKEGEGEGVVWWELLAFGETAAADLMKLRAGDGIAVNGAFRAEVYIGRDGQARLQHKLFVDNVISTRKAPRRSRDQAEAAGPRPSADDDDLPF